MTQAPNVLLITSREVPDAVIQGLKSLNARILTAKSWSEARGLLGDGPPPDVVITDVSLPDGNWFSVLTEIGGAGAANLLVVDRISDDRFDRTVIGRGGFGVVHSGEPAERTLRLVEQACSRHRVH